MCRVAPRPLGPCSAPFADHGALWKNHLFQALIEVVSEGKRFQALARLIHRWLQPRLDQLGSSCQIKRKIKICLKSTMYINTYIIYIINVLHVHIYILLLLLSLLLL